VEVDWAESMMVLLMLCAMFDSAWMRLTLPYAARCTLSELWRLSGGNWWRPWGSGRKVEDGWYPECLLPRRPHRPKSWWFRGALRMAKSNIIAAPLVYPPPRLVHIGFHGAVSDWINGEKHVVTLVGG